MPYGIFAPVDEVKLPLIEKAMPHPVFKPIVVEKEIVRDVATEFCEVELNGLLGMAFDSEAVLMPLMKQTAFASFGKHDRHNRSNAR